MRRLAILAALGFGAALSVPAWALDYLSVAEPSAMYDAPSQKAHALFAIAAGTPVEAVVTLDAWVKVRDAKGNLAWMEKRNLSQARTVMVKVERAEVHAQADEKSPLVFEAAKDVVLEWLEPGPLGWAHVKHRDGQSGFVKAAQVWGM
ncbi:MAG: SH3 domain-containing protein [Rhodocyclaceae bacterium]|nr:SH3 domain-containing protein [Rhodocyclaceae bacterium]